MARGGRHGVNRLHLIGRVARTVGVVREGVVVLLVVGGGIRLKLVGHLGDDADVHALAAQGLLGLGTHGEHERAVRSIILAGGRIDERRLGALGGGDRSRRIVGDLGEIGGGRRHAHGDVVKRGDGAALARDRLRVAEERGRHAGGLGIGIVERDVGRLRRLTRVHARSIGRMCLGHADALVGAHGVQLHLVRGKPGFGGNAVGDHLPANDALAAAHGEAGVHVLQGQHRLQVRAQIQRVLQVVAGVQRAVGHVVGGVGGLVAELVGHRAVVGIVGEDGVLAHGRGAIGAVADGRVDLAAADVGDVHGAQLVGHAVGGLVVHKRGQALGVGILRLQIDRQLVAGIGAGVGTRLLAEGRRGVVVEVAGVSLGGIVDALTSEHVIVGEGVGGGAGRGEQLHGTIDIDAVVLEGVVHHGVRLRGGRLGGAHVVLALAGEPLAGIERGVREAAVGVGGLEGDLQLGEQGLRVGLIHLRIARETGDGVGRGDAVISAIRYNVFAIGVPRRSRIGAFVRLVVAGVLAGRRSHIGAEEALEVDDVVAVGIEGGVAVLVVDDARGTGGAGSRSALVDLPRTAHPSGGLQLVEGDVDFLLGAVGVHVLEAEVRGVEPTAVALDAGAVLVLLATASLGQNVGIVVLGVDVARNGEVHRRVRMVALGVHLDHLVGIGRIVGHRLGALHQLASAAILHIGAVGLLREGRVLVADARAGGMVVAMHMIGLGVLGVAHEVGRHVDVLQAEGLLVRREVLVEGALQADARQVRGAVVVDVVAHRAVELVLEAHLEGGLGRRQVVARIVDLLLAVDPGKGALIAVVVDALGIGVPTDDIGRGGISPVIRVARDIVGAVVGPSALGRDVLVARVVTVGRGARDHLILGAILDDPMGRGVVLVIVLGVVRQRAVVLGLDAGGIAVAHLVAHHPGGVVGAVARHPAVAVARVAELTLVAVHDGPVVIGVQGLLRAREEGRRRVVAVVVHMGRGDGVVDVVLETGLLGRGARGVELVVLSLVDVGASQYLVVGGRLPAAAVAVVGARRLGGGVGIAAVGAEVQRVARHELAVGQVNGERLVIREVAGLGNLGGDHLAVDLRLLLVAVLRSARPVHRVHEVGRVVARALEVDERVAVLVQTLGEQVGETGGRRLVHFLVLAGVGPGDGVQVLIDHGLGAVGVHEVHVVLTDANGAVHRMGDLGPVGGGELVGAPRPLAPAVVGGGQRFGLGLRRRVGAVGHLVPRRGAQGDEHLVEVVSALGAGVVGHRVQMRPHVRRRHGGDGAVGRGRAVLGGAEELQAHAEVAVVLQILIGIDGRQRVVDADVVRRRDIGAPGLVVVVAVVGIVAARFPAVQRHEVALVVREDALVGMVVRHVGVTGPTKGARIAVHGLLHEVAALVGDHARGGAQMAHLALVELVEVVVVVVAAVVGAPAVVAALAGTVEVLVGPGAATVLVVVEVQRLGARGPHVAEGGGDVAVDVACVAPPARVVGAGGQRLARGTVVLVAVVHGALVRRIVALGSGVHVLLTGVLAADGHVHRGGGGHRVGRRGGRGLIGADEAARHLEGHVLRPLGRACAEAVGEPLAVVGDLRVAGRVQRALVDGHVVDDLGHAEGGHAVGVVVEGVAVGVGVLFSIARHMLGVGRLRVRGQIDRVATGVHHLHEVQAEEVVALVVQLHGGGHAAVVALVERVVVLRADGVAVDNHLLAIAELDRHLVQVGQGLLLDLDVVGVEALAGDVLHHLQMGAGVVGVGAHGVEARVAVGPVVAEVVSVVVGAAVVVVLVVDVARHVAVGGVVDEAGAVHPAGVLVVVGPVAVAALAAGGIEVRVALLHEEGGLGRHRACCRAGRIRVVAGMPVRMIGDVAQVRLGRRVHLAEVHKEGALGLVADGQVSRSLVHRRAPAVGMPVVVAVVGAGGVVREAGRLGIARQVLRVVDLLGGGVPRRVRAVDELRVAHAACGIEH